MKPGLVRRLALGVALFSLGCARESDSQPRRVSVASGSAAPKTPDGPAPSASPKTPPDPGAPAVSALDGVRCRAMRVKGAATRAETGVPLAALEPVGDWVTLGPGAELLVRDARSAREFLLRGPAHARPCGSEHEQILLEHGTFQSVPGTGVRPGAEVWIGTPFGTARYADASFELTADVKDWRLSVQSGTVWTEPSVLVSGRPAENRVRSGETGAGRTAPPAVGDLLKACRAREVQARNAAAAVSSGGPSLGKRAAAEFVLRRSARAACLWASAAERRALSSGRALPPG